MIWLAHVGHWWGYLLYAIPLAIVLASIVTTTLRARRGGGRDRGTGPG
ncbi:MAG: hypothetical protein ABI726_00695 [bacterium]